jgi:non-specific serine/threonine protein kinase/serine/threonine-protein kinase
MQLSAEELAILSRLLDEALDLEESAREAWLESLVEHFPGSKLLLRKMLALEATGEAESFLGTLPKLSMETEVAEPDADTTLFQAGARIGHYRLVREIGHGGMGQVWLAEQTEPVRRFVALKLISAGMYDASVVQRFKSERQSLAIMDHPAIAKVFDAGSTAQGQPYFVMEYVPGLPISEYCDQRRLKIPERLELFIQVCDGVQHAHQKAIIHRDLKPANILIVEVDGRAVPRIIDFGLAKPTTPRVVPEQSLYTRVGQFVGTPGYMSPEQVDPKIQDIDTRTDVYSLGVVLYVLLTGLQPFETKRRRRPAIDEWLRQLREEEPPSLSAKVSTDRESAAKNAAARSTEPKQLMRVLRGDLDCIGTKAIERDRERRYGAPSELAADLRRYLNHEPVMARPASVPYRMLKYTRRHRVAVGVAAGVTALLVAFTVLQALELRRTTQERDRATRITDFMTGIFKVSDPSEARGKNVTAREILDKAASEIGTGLASDSEVQSQMLQVMASTYLNLGLYTRAQELAKRARAVRLSLHGADDPKTLESTSQLGWILDREGHHTDAEKLEREALRGEQRVLGSENALTLETMDHLAVILEDQGHFDEAEKLARQVIEAATRQLGPTSSLTLQSTNHLAWALLSQARYAEAEEQYRRLIEVDRRVFGADHPQTLPPMMNLALAVEQQGRLTEAERLYREVLATQQRVLGPEHQFTVLTMDNLAAVLTEEHRFVEGEELHRNALEIRLRTLGPEHRDTLLSKINLAEVLFKEGHVGDAEKLTRETLAAQSRVLGPEHPETLDSQSLLATILIGEGQYREAESIAAKTFAVQLRILGAQHSDTIDTLRQLGRAMAYSDRYPEASNLFHDLIGRPASATQGNRWSVWYAFAAVAAAANRHDDALRYLREAVNRGYVDANGLTDDDEFLALRPDPQFQELVAALKTPRKPGT